MDCKVLKFADDTKIIKSIKTIKDNILFQKDIDKLFATGDNIEMPFNTDKCRSMHFGSRHIKFNYSMGANG